MFKKKLILIVFAFTSSCSSEKNHFKEGKFMLYESEGDPMIIERDDKYQLEYSIDNSKIELFKVHWQEDSIYQLESMHKEDSNDFINLLVKIDSTINDTLYLTSSMKGVEFTVSSKMIKIDDNLSNKFKEILKTKTAH